MFDQLKFNELYMLMTGGEGIMKNRLWMVISIVLTWSLCPVADANTEWTDMVSPINHSLWKDIAIADFNTDGIPDLVAANPDAAEQFSDYSGLPVWIGQIYNGPGGTYYWGLSAGAGMTGNSASFPQSSVGNGARPHVSCIYNGNTCNMMAEWLIAIESAAGIHAVTTISGDATFTVTIPAGLHWRDVFHTETDLWTFEQISSTETFTVKSQRYGNQSNQMTLGQTYSSDMDRITIFVTRNPPSGGTGQKFTVLTRPALASISANYRDYPDPEFPRYVLNAGGDSRIEPGKWFEDGGSLMKFRWDPKASDLPIQPGQTWHFHTPDGPHTNKAYNAVEAYDVNRDGQVDIVAAGNQGIDVFLQTGPSISEVGFRPIKPDENFGAYDCNLVVGLGDVSGFVNPSVVYDECYEIEYEESLGGFFLRGLFTGASGDMFFPNQPQTFYCGEVTVFEYSGGPVADGDKFTFSTKRINWGSRTGPSASGNYTNMIIGDITNNGWIDIVVTRQSGGMEMYEYNGFEWSQGQSIPFNDVISALVLEDLDRDGWKDIVASSDQGVHLWKGLPNGNWSSDYGPVRSGREFLGVAAGDFNKDGFVDLAATEDLSGTTGTIQIWYLGSDGQWFQQARASTPAADPNNVGNGFMSFIKVSHTQSISEYWTIVCQTAEPDGGLFKVQGSRSGIQSQYASVGEVYTSDNGEVEFTIFDGQIDYALNDNFTFYTGRGPLDLKKFGAIATSDLNNDGNLDLFTTSLDNFGVGIWFGNGHYGWKADTQPESSNSWQTLESDKDLNFDGNPDIVVGSYADSGGAGAGIKIWVGRHNTENTWSDWIYKPIVNGKFNKIANGDLNHDGIEDMVLACSEPTAEGLWVFTGNGLGEFEKVTNEVTSKKGYFSVCTGDFNLDGLSDIAAGRLAGGFDVFLTQEDLTWSFSTSSITTGEVYDIEAVDIDLDGNLDILIAQEYLSPDQTGVMVYFNDGNANFSSLNRMAFSGSIYVHWSATAVDLDRNGVLDIITTNTTGNPGTLIYYGYWSSPTTPAYGYPMIWSSSSGLDHNFGLVASDFNLDNRPDLVVGEDGHGSLAFIGYTGVTSECAFGFTGAGYGKIRDMSSSDLNNDGYPDLVFACEQEGVQAFLTNPGFPGWAAFSMNSIEAPASDGDYVGVITTDVTNDGLNDVISSRNQSTGVSGLDLWISNRDFSLPRVNNTFPSDGGEFNIGQHYAVFVYFNKPMDPTTLTYENLIMTRDGDMISYSIVTENDNQTIRLTPNLMIRNSEYSVTIVGGLEGVRDSIGNVFDGNSDGQAQASPFDDYTFSFTTVDRVPPSIPVGLTVIPGDSQALLRWLPNSDPELDVDLQGYYVIWQVADHTGPLNWKFYDKDLLGTPPQILIRGLNNNVEYEFSLTSLDYDENESAFSAQVKSIPIAVRPQIWWAGMYDTMITASDGGELTLLAYVIDMQGDIESVELYYDNLPTGVYLADGGHPDFPAGLGLYALNAPVGSIGSGYLEIPFQLVARDAAGNESMMWPYYHIQNDLPGGTAANPFAGYTEMDAYFAAREKQFLNQTTIPVAARQQPSVAIDRPQILCAGFTAHPEADFEFGANHWMTAIIIDPDNRTDFCDVSHVDLYYHGFTQPFINEGTVNIGKLDQLDLNYIIWAADMTWYGEQTDPNGPDGGEHWPVGPQFMEIQAFDREGNASDIWPNFTIN